MADGIKEARRLARVVWGDTATVRTFDSMGARASVWIGEFPQSCRMVCSVGVLAPPRNTIKCQRPTRRAALAGLCAALRVMAGDGK